MKFTLAVTFNIDPAGWAEEYGLDTTTVAVEDITDVLTRAAEDGSLAAALTSQWPMMREAATITAAGPGAVLAHIDWTETLAATEVAKMEYGPRELLRAALRKQDSAVNDSHVLDTVREVLQREHPDRAVTGVVFHTLDFDNGNFLTNTGEVYFADGSTDTIEFDDIDETFTEEFGSRGDRFALAVDLRGTGEIHFDDYAGNVYAKLGVKPKQG